MTSLPTKNNILIKYSVVIPVYNEEAAIPLLFNAVKSAMDKISPLWEMILVDDGSKDSSLAAMKNIKTQGSCLVIAALKKHYGKSYDLQAGFDNAQGEIIITMDADLQNDPEDIPKLLNKLENGFDVVCGWRHPRKDPWLRILQAKIAGFIRKVIWKEKIHDIGCAFRVFKKEAINGVYLSGGMQRFFTLIMLKLGRKIGEVQILHHCRRFGRTKYNIGNRIFEGANDLIKIVIFDVKALTQHKPAYEIREIIRKQ